MKITTTTDYWRGLVVPDYQEFRNHPGDLRAAFHLAITLFHMHDWVWTRYEAAIRRSFSFVDGKGLDVPVHNARSFANALEQQCADFGRLWGIANAAKHLEIVDVRPVANAPSTAASTCSQTMTSYFGSGYFGSSHFGRYFGNSQKIMLETAGGKHIGFSDIAQNVYDMWERLRASHGW
jgi:hypothetical protein